MCTTVLHVRACALPVRACVCTCVCLRVLHRAFRQNELSIKTVFYVWGLAYRTGDIEGTESLGRVS